MVSARDSQGLFYGAVTLWQLCSAPVLGHGRLALWRHADHGRTAIPWRGLMLDSARHFQSPQFIMQYIDWMALHKLNVLGWHLTDDQGWRLEIKKYPRLTVSAPGAYRRAARRSATSIRRPAGHASTAGSIPRKKCAASSRTRRSATSTIVPEVDMPAHATAAMVAYPALAASAADLPAAVPADWGIYPHLFNIEETTFRFSMTCSMK